MNLECSIGSLKLSNPVLLASGTCGYGVELSDLLDLSNIGGVVVKGISIEPRQGNPPPRLVETPCGLLNSIGLENDGVDDFLSRKLPFLKRLETEVVVNILGNSPEDYAKIAYMLDGKEGISALEVNVSCPNVKEGGIAFGASALGAASVTSAVRNATKLPIIVKLSPNVTDIKEIARATEEAGADAVSLINTLLGMAIDIEKARPALANIFGGLSGPAIKPVALRMVWQVVDVVKIPVIGVGGIFNWKDAIEFFMAGATAVEVGTATLVNPDSSYGIVEGVKEFLIKKGLESPADLRIRR